MCERNGDSDVADAGTDTRRRDEGARGFGVGEGAQRKLTSGGMMMINGTVVKHWSRTQATRALSTAEGEHDTVITEAAEALGMQMDDEGLGLGRASSSLDRLQRCQCNRNKEGIVKTRDAELRYLWLEDMHDQHGRSEHETSSSGVEFDRPVDEGQVLARN